MVKDIVQVLILLTIFILLKKSGLAIYGRKRYQKGYINVFENEKRKIVITVKRKIFGIIERNRNYELKYVKVKNNIEEIRQYLDIIIKDKEYILREMRTGNFFDFKKRGVILLRDTIATFNKVPLILLPETELKGIVSEMLELDIVELEKGDFGTLREKMMYNTLVKGGNNEKK